MPRNKCTQTIEHRITFGAWERERIRESQLVAGTAVLLPGLGIVVLAGGTVLVAYSVYQWLKDGPFQLLGDFFTPEWRDANIPVWSDEQREAFREEHPSMWGQALQGPSVLWQTLFG